MLRALITIAMAISAANAADAQSPPAPLSAPLSAPLGPLFKAELTDCDSVEPLNFQLLPAGHRCELTDVSRHFSLISSVPCGCTSRNSFGDEEVTCVLGGPAKATVGASGQERTLFVAVQSIAFLRLNRRGEMVCRAAQIRDATAIGEIFEKLVPRPSR